LVSLPKRWIVKNHLSRGDTVAIEESRSGPLLVYPKDVTSLEETSFHTVRATGQDPQAVVRDVTAAYLLGYNVINVVGDRAQLSRVKRYLRESVHGLLGLETVAEEQSSLTLQFILDLNTIHPEKLYRRMNVLARSMYVDCLEAASEGDITVLEDVLRRDEEINRLFFLMVRLLRSALTDARIASKLGLSSVQCLDYRLASHHVELLGDHSFALASILKGLPPFPERVAAKARLVSENLSSLHDMANAYFLGSKEMDYSSFLNRARDVESLISSLRSEMGSSAVADRLEDIRRLIVDIGDLAEILYPYVR